jgi:hypothetical protein
MSMFDFEAMNAQYLVDKHASAFVLTIFRSMANGWSMSEPVRELREAIRIADAHDVDWGQAMFDALSDFSDRAVPDVDPQASFTETQLIKISTAALTYMAARNDQDKAAAGRLSQRESSMDRAIKDYVEGSLLRSSRRQY